MIDEGRARSRHLLTAGLCALAGAAAAVALLLATGWRHVPVHEYRVAVQFEVEATADQAAEVRAVLEGVPSGKGVEVDSRADMLARFQEYYEKDGLTPPEDTTAADMYETYTVTTTGRDFDCALITGLRARPGVDDASVSRTHGGSGQVAILGCQ